MSSLKKYHDVYLVESEADCMKKLEQMLKEEIPCAENRDATREKMEKMAIQRQQQMTAQRAAMTISPLQAQYQGIMATESQLDQQEKMSIEQLENMYSTSFLQTTTPAYKSQIEAQLNMMLPALGENHPTIKQFRDLLDMDEEKAKTKAKLAAQFYYRYFKIRILNKEEYHKLIKSMYSESSTLEDLKKASNEYYNTITKPDYQSLLKEVISLGLNTVGQSDPIMAKLKPLIGMDENAAETIAMQTAQQAYQNIQNMLKQHVVQQQMVRQAAETTQDDNWAKKIPHLSHFGYACDEHRVIALYVGWRNIVNLPECIGNLEKLRYLNLENNKIETLPDNFGNLKDLEELIIDRGNELLELPENFDNLTKLRILKLSENKLKKLPRGFSKLVKLEEIEITGNNLTELPEDIGNLQNLLQLHVRSNKISTIPTSLFKCQKLIMLDFSFNPIGIIPEGIAQLKDLKYLYLMNNELSDLPDDLWDLVSLVNLFLNGNQLEELSEDILRLNLTQLSVSDNKLSELPYFIWALESLDKLDLKNNLLSPEELEVVESDAETIKDYCRQRASIAIMMIASEEDAKAHRLPELIEYLEKQSEVYGVLPEDEENLDSIDLIIFLATGGSVSSTESLKVLNLGKERGIDVIPLKGTNIGWVDLATIGLSRELGHEFTPDDFDGFCEKIYDYIQLLKRKQNVFKDKSGLVRKEIEKVSLELDSIEAVSIELLRIVNSSDFKAFFEMYKPYLKPTYDTLSVQKWQGIPSFLSILTQYYQTYINQTKGGT